MENQNNWSKRQLEILDTSLKILAQEGAKSLTLKRIAEIIGVSEAAVYRHFSGKKELILSLHKYVKDQIINRLTNVSIKTNDPISHLELILVETISYLKDNKGITLIFLSESIYHNDEDFKRSLKEIISSIKNKIKSIIEIGISHGEFRRDLNPELAAIILMGIIQMSQIHYVVGGVDFEPSQFVKTFIPILLEGFINVVSK